jgi:ABC-type Fe3+-hydroxamate transport system substrate-binding protein
MNGAMRSATGSLIGAFLAVTLAACSDRGDLSIENNSPNEVVVVIGNEEITVDAGGGAALLDYGCTPGDITVRFASDPEVMLSGPVCPAQRVVVGDGTATLRPVAASHT